MIMFRFLSVISGYDTSLTTSVVGAELDEILKARSNFGYSRLASLRRLFARAPI